MSNTSNPINPELIQLLACPDCKNDLFEINDQLKCISCNKEYKVKNGIPLLYPRNMDFVHLQEEEKLAKMMKRSRLSPKEQFSAIQWKSSKEEFWRMIQKNIKTIPKTIINIGCGYDTNFVEFERQGYVFVNFDLVYDTLYTCQSDFGARTCIAGDINSLPFKKNSFNYVVCIDVIHHETYNLLNLLKSFSELLKPGGSLFLEDINAWGMFQFVKTILLPKPLFKFLRSIYHRLRHSDHAPADYEFPTSVWNVKKILERSGFSDIKVYPNNAYPSIDYVRFKFYNFFSKIEYIQKYHNYHYTLSAVKRDE